MNDDVDDDESIFLLQEGGGGRAVRVRCYVCRLSLFLASITACLSPCDESEGVAALDGDGNGGEVASTSRGKQKCTGVEKTVSGIVEGSRMNTQHFH